MHPVSFIANAAAATNQPAIYSLLTPNVLGPYLK